MTTATVGADKKSLGAKDKTEVGSPAIDKKGTTGATLRRLLGYMAGGEARGKFIGGVLVRVVALLGLTAMPFVIGQGTNVISEPGGTVEELMRWAIVGVIAGAVYLTGSLFADRIISDLATKALSKLQIHLFSRMQTLSMGFFYRTPVG